MNKRCILVLFAGSFVMTLSAQQGPAGKPPTPVSATSVAPSAPQGAKAGPKPYKEVITDKAISTRGLFTVDKLDDKVFFEIPDSILNRDIMVVSFLSKAGVDMRQRTTMSGYAGDQINSSVVRFEKGPNNKLFLRDLSYSERSKDSSKAMFQTVMNSNIQPIAMAFEIRAWHKDSVSGGSSAVVEVTDLINSDNDIFFFGAYKPAFGIGAYQPDKSYMLDVKTYPINTEIKTVKTYIRAPMQVQGLPSIPSAGPVTVELNTSMVLLPKIPMQARYADARVGYFTNDYTDFDANPQGIKQISQIARWRLEPREEDIEKYKRGELVEPKKPIIIYIDPATPSKWAPFLIAGINDWQVAFEKAGFKNAIFGKRAPTLAEDSSWSLDDARNSAVVYKPSSVANASGPHLSDPRSGEIMETHINWYHNVMNLLHDWYLIQAAAIDPRARKMQLDDSLMGQLIRFVSSHEIGHTLGLMHNFGSSSGTPVEKLRDKAWVEEHGHTASIMDYARFNYVAQPEDHISEKGIFPRIGDYDKWAIEFGYRWIPEAKTPEEEATVLNKWVIEKAKDSRYWFGNGEMSDEDPRSQTEDLGDNAMKASAYGIRNLKIILTGLPEWTRTPNEGYRDLDEMYNQATLQFSRYLGHVVRNVGGVYNTPKSIEQAGPVYVNVPAATQKEAIDFLNKQLFATPNWLIDKKLVALTGRSPVVTIGRLQDGILFRLLNPMTMGKLVNAEGVDENAYKLTDLFSDLHRGIWEELNTKQAITLYRRNLQRSYMDRLVSIVRPAAAPGAPGGRASGAAVKSTEVGSMARAELVWLRLAIRQALPMEKDVRSRYHLQDMLDKINEALTIKGDS